MELDANGSGRGKLARVLLAAALGIAALRWLWSGKRVRGVLAGVGALVLGYAATSDSGGPAETFDVGTVDEDADSADDDVEEPDDVDATTEDAELRCAACGEPIRVGQSRGPNENDEVVHDACK